MAKISGTKEWAKYNANCCKGCINDCRYCYAKYNAIHRWKNVQDGAWTTPVINWNKAKEKWSKKDGTIMFPTTHDIFPDNLRACLTILKNMLEAGNDVLIVSKPNFECIKKLCEELSRFKEQILLRFTIGALDNRVLTYWEPGAPLFGERFDSLQWAYGSGYDTSVSCEPMLDSDGVVQLFDVLCPYVTDGIWIGKMNKIDQRVDVGDSDLDKEMISMIESGQTDKRIFEIYEALKDDPKIRWKESFKSVLGLDLATEAGADI